MNSLANNRLMILFKDGSSHTIQNKVIKSNYAFGLNNTLNTMRIFDVNAKPNTFLLDNQMILNPNVQYNGETKVNSIIFREENS